MFTLIHFLKLPAQFYVGWNNEEQEMFQVTTDVWRLEMFEFWEERRWPEYNLCRMFRLNQLVWNQNVWLENTVNLHPVSLLQLEILFRLRFEFKYGCLLYWQISNSMKCPISTKCSWSKTFPTNSNQYRVNTPSWSYNSMLCLPVGANTLMRDPC